MQSNSDSPNPQESAARPQTVVRRGPQPRPVYMVQQSGWSRFVSWLGWLGLMICIPIIVGMATKMKDYFDTSNGIQEKYHSLSKTASDKIAIINIDGVIMDGRGYVRSQIDRVRADKNVKAIVLRVNSPGGTITGSDYIHHHLKELLAEKEIPMVVSMGSVAASGGYYVAMAAGDEEDTIFAEPTTATGSIGVIMPHYDISGLMEDYNVVDDSIATHPRKQMLSMTKRMSEEDREIAKAYINEYFVRFKEIIKGGRSEFREDESKLDELATGEVFSATQALSNGLIDKIGFIEEAIECAIEKAGLDESKVRVVTFNRPVTLMDAIVNANASDSKLARLFESSTPQAYYLWSSLPTLESTNSRRSIE